MLVLLILATLSLSFLGQNKTASVHRDVFGVEHYLFANAVPASQAPDLSIIENAVLAPQAPAFLVKGKTLASLDGQESLGSGAKNEPDEYIVEKGDTLKSLAEKFGISVETIAWANDLSTKATLKSGQKLIILPVSGILHLVKKGDTISEIAQLYKADVQDIINFNGLDGADICIGDLLIIPGGNKPKVAQPRYTTVPLSQSYFIVPMPLPCKITQGAHWFNAVDFANGNCGDPVFAAAGGEVQKVSYGNNSGNYVKIVHPNGAITTYGHLAKAQVIAGEKVSQGQIIGQIGYTGYTIPKGPEGCHLHFDVMFAENPFTRLAVGSTIAK
ncbi:MAG: M23 family metallopeptidase [Candidatus Pacebacteria bacterium]|nr:M23 family metallopeptidase [Candidatus Paceibacterota bacterium]